MTVLILRFILAVIVSQNLLSFDDLDSFRSTHQIFGVGLRFFSWLDQIMGSGEGIHRDKLKFRSHHVAGTCYQRELTSLMLILMTWLRQRLLGFSTVTLLLFPHFLYWVSDLRFISMKSHWFSVCIAFSSCESGSVDFWA